MKWLAQSQKIEMLKKVPLFANLNKRQLSLVAKLSYEIPFPAHKMLASEGDRGREFYILLEGQARVEKGGKIVGKLGKGDFFGEIAIIDGHRSATVITETPVKALGMSSKSFDQLLDSAPEITKKLLYAVCSYLRMREGSTAAGL